MTFTADQFTPTKFDTAKDKAKFANHYVRFVEKDFPKGLFHKWFYTRLSMTFGHIAHFNQEGFYATWFSSLNDRLHFLEHHRDWQCYGSPEYTYCDVEKALANWIHTTDYIKKLSIAVNNDTERKERNQLAYLKQKYEN